MSAFKLSLPTDIPWRRVCVSEDMIDPVACDNERPARWHSSLAAFRYDPAEEYQPYPTEVVSYIKLVATIAPFQWNEPGVTPTPDFVPQEIVDDIEESFPCYGAVLQVTVAPHASDRDNFSPEQYPYFIDCEPKKRELYEMVSDTSEVLSGSLTNLSLGKAGTDTHSTEDYNLDLGGGGGFGLAWGLVSADWSGQQQTGTKSGENRQTQSTRTTDFSTERREVQSHTTQLTQMYNLFQAFHLGTNRALFLIEPRPHIRQTEATFINGPRAIEGIQEVFLVVVRPKTMADFCIGALLETAHVTLTPPAAPPPPPPKSDVWVVNWHEEATIGDSNYHTTVSKADEYLAPEGWEITNFALTTGPNQKATSPVFTPGKAHFDQGKTSKSLTATGTLQKWVVEDDEGIDQENAFIQFSVEVFLRKAAAEDGDPMENDQAEYVRRLFLTARELCCCPPTRRVAQDWITDEIDLSRYRWRAYSGLGSPQRFLESRRIAAAIRKEMVRSFTSSKRHTRGELRYQESDAFHVRVADLLRARGRQDRLGARLADVPTLDDTARGQLYRALGHVTVEDVLTTDATALARKLRVDEAEVGRLKKDLLRGVAAETNPWPRGGD
jgi:hypothetical protein